MNQFQSKSYEIVVAGGGPAGIVTAVKLHSLGHHVLLITTVNRSQCELQTLSPGVLTLAKTIGLNADQIHSNLTPIIQTRKFWSGISEEIIYPSSFLVHRRNFDDELLIETRNLGVQVMQPAKIVDCRYVNNIWELTIIREGKYFTLKAKFLVDATGKKSALRGRKNKVAASTIAITGCWRNTPYRKLSTQLESTPTNWLWGGRLSGDLFHATVFTDAAAISGQSKLMVQYINAVKKTKLFGQCLRGTLTGRLSAVDVTPYYYEKPVSEHFIKVGEASTGFDPQSSQGVQQAMSNAIQAAIVVHSILSDVNVQQTAFNFYTSRQQEAIRTHLVMTANSYLSVACWKNEPFWQNRTRHGIPARTLEPQGDTGLWESTTAIRVSPEVLLKSVACIEKDLITSKMGIIHPGLDGPILYLQNQEIGKIIKTIGNRTTVSDLVQSWELIMPRTSAFQLIHSLKEARILEAIGR
jgi:flavin-dependent dehydrogenase